jgi:hypothetical protein
MSKITDNKKTVKKSQTSQTNKQSDKYCALKDIKFCDNDRITYKRLQKEYGNQIWFPLRLNDKSITVATEYLKFGGLSCIPKIQDPEKVPNAWIKSDKDREYVDYVFTEGDSASDELYAVVLDCQTWANTEEMRKNLFKERSRELLFSDIIKEGDVKDKNGVISHIRKIKLKFPMKEDPKTKKKYINCSVVKYENGISTDINKDGKMEISDLEDAMGKHYNCKFILTIDHLWINNLINMGKKKGEKKSLLYGVKIKVDVIKFERTDSDFGPKKHYFDSDEENDSEDNSKKSPCGPIDSDDEERELTKKKNDKKKNRSNDSDEENNSDNENEAEEASEPEEDEGEAEEVKPEVVKSRSKSKTDKKKSKSKAKYHSDSEPDDDVKSDNSEETQNSPVKSRKNKDSKKNKKTKSRDNDSANASPNESENESESEDNNSKPTKKKSRK